MRRIINKWQLLWFELDLKLSLVWPGLWDCLSSSFCAFWKHLHRCFSQWDYSSCEWSSKSVSKVKSINFGCTCVLGRASTWVFCDFFVVCLNCSGFSICPVKLNWPKLVDICWWFWGNYIHWCIPRNWCDFCIVCLFSFAGLGLVITDSFVSVLRCMCTDWNILKLFFFILY